MNVIVYCKSDCRSLPHATQARPAISNLVRTFLPLSATLNLTAVKLSAVRLSCSLAAVLLQMIRAARPIRMANSPPLSPTVATPVAHRKRRHSVIERDVIDLTGNDGDSTVDFGTAPTSPAKLSSPHKPGTHATESSATAAVARKLEDDDEIDEDDKELLEDILDTAELEPYKPGKLY